MANDGRRQHRVQQRVELGECYVAVFQQASTRGGPARIRRIAIVDDRDMIGAMATEVAVAKTTLTAKRTRVLTKGSLMIDRPGMDARPAL